jgi:hypothetical protein
MLRASGELWRAGMSGIWAMSCTEEMHENTANCGNGRDARKYVAILPHGTLAHCGAVVSDTRRSVALLAFCLEFAAIFGLVAMDLAVRAKSFGLALH